MSLQSNENSRADRDSSPHSAFATVDNALVLAGGFPLSPSHWATIAIGLQLSDRELQVIQGVFDGGSEADIGKRLYLSTHTIHSHVGRIYRRLHVSSRTGLVLRVFAEYLAQGYAHAIVPQIPSGRFGSTNGSPRATGQTPPDRAVRSDAYSGRASRLCRSTD